MEIGMGGQFKKSAEYKGTNIEYNRAVMGWAEASFKTNPKAFEEAVISRQLQGTGIDVRHVKMAYQCMKVPA